MTKEILLNAFRMNCVSHVQCGMWRHPRDRMASDYKTLDYWTDLARTLERGKVDGLFLADAIGIYDVYTGSPEPAIRTGLQVPSNDPMAVIPAMAMVTQDLAFAVTGQLTYESPAPLARRMSTLDHLTEGRFSWNIVTGYLQSAAKSAGQAVQVEHDTRYDMAEEYMDIMYKLWESSWEDDALAVDKAEGVMAHPDRVHKITHDGQFFAMEAVHLSEPSPQRTPVLYQAGASSKGRAFAGKHAECVFLVVPSIEALAEAVTDIRDRATAAGRAPEDVKLFQLMAVITAPTDEEANEKLEDYRQYVSHEAALTLFAGWTGIDFSTMDLDAELGDVSVPGIQSAVEMFKAIDPEHRWTIREMAEFIAFGGPGPVVCGSPATVADELERWMDETDIDGFNLTPVLEPESYVDFVDLVVPELQRRGRYKEDYRPGVYREKLFGRGPVLAAPHVGASYRAG